MLLRNRRLCRPRFLLIFSFLFICLVFYVLHAAGAVDPRIGTIRGAQHVRTYPKDDFISKSVAFDTADDWDHTYVKGLCDKQDWVDELVFECQEIVGGIGNVKQAILSCIRFAMDSGAGILMPVIGLRSESELSNLESGLEPLEYLFDKDRFLERMAKACPQMKIFENATALQSLGPVTRTEEVSPRNEQWKLPLGGLAVTTVRKKVKQVMAQKGQISLVPFAKIISYFPVCHDGAGFTDTFGQVLPFRSDVYHLASTALYELRDRFNLPLDPDSLIPPSSAFMGIHLRTSKDILAHWPSYEKQANYFLNLMSTSTLLSSLPVIYAASGNATSVILFENEVHIPYPSTQLVTKTDLLSGADLEKLRKLTWDQQALVDFLILSRSSFFMGGAESSFAWAVAIRRRILTKAGSCGPWRTGLWSGYLWGTASRDEFSDLIGGHPFGWESKMWP